MRMVNHTKWQQIAQRSTKQYKIAPNCTTQVTDSESFDVEYVHLMESVSRERAFATDPVGWQKAQDSELGSLVDREVFEDVSEADVPAS